MNRSTIGAALVCLVLCATTGCGYVRQMSSPTLKRLAGQGGGMVPNEADAIAFQSSKFGDEQLASAFADLKAYGFRDVNFRGSAISDRSVPLVAQLHTVRTLNLVGTRVTPAGYAGLRPMKSLRLLWADEEALGAAGLDELRSTLKGVEVRAGG